MTGSARRVLLIGLDGADWRLLTPLIDRGAMPNLQRIIEQGTSGRLAAPPVAQADVGWTNALTGVHAHVHGILDLEVPSRDGGVVERASASDRRAPVVWEIASAAGIGCVHVGWGSVIGDGGVADEYATAASPWSARCAGAGSDLLEEVVERVVPVADARDQVLVERFRALLAQSDATVQLAIAAMGARPWQLAAIRLAAFGELLSDFVRFVPPAPAWVMPRRASAFATAVEQACRIHDALIGHLVAAAGDGTAGNGSRAHDELGPVAVVIATPRGTPIEHLRSDPTSARTATLRNRPSGIVAASGPDVQRDALAFGAAAIDLCPTVLARLGCACPAHVQGRAIRGIGSAPADGAQARGANAQRAAPDDVGLAKVDGISAEARAIARRRAIACADSYADAGLWRSAADVMRQLADEWPADAHLALRCIALMRDAGDVDAAVARMASMPSVPPELMEVRALIEASLHAVKDRHRDALGLLQTEQQRQESAGAGAVSAALHVARARSQLSLGQLAEAERSCGLALQSDPEFRDAHVAHAQVLYAAERYADAAGAGLRAIALAHFDPPMHFLVGTALAALGRAHDAVAELLIAVDQDPGLVAAYRRLAAVHLRQLGNVDAAQRYAALAGKARAAKSDSVE